jgi:hypothetical protein
MWLDIRVLVTLAVRNMNVAVLLDCTDVEINQLNALNYILLYSSFTMAPTCFGKTMPSSGSDYVPF